MNKDKKPLSVTHPELAKEAYGWDPSEITYGSHKKMLWRCEFQHDWYAIVKSRSIGGNGCPICSGHQVLEGFNDLATISPVIAREAFGWDPSEYTASSGRKMEWICKFGHITQKRIADKVNGIGCPICSGHQVLEGFNDLATTHPELAEEAYGWDANLVTYGSNSKFNWKCKLGHIFESSPANRAKKYKGTGCPFCAGQKVLKGFNDLSTTHPEIAKEAFGWDPTSYSQGSDKIELWKCSKNHHYKSAINNRSRGKGCPYCAGQKVLKGFNDLATTHPELAKEAFGWDPTTVSAGSHKKLEWICENGHLRTLTPHSRFQREQKKRTVAKCVYCTNQKVLKGFNDLSTTHPEIAKEAFGWDPTTVIAGSDKKLKWKCTQGHVWNAVVNSRRTELKSPSNCPYCGNYFLWPGFNDLATKYPHIANESFGWDPKKVLFGSATRKKWKCKSGHTWTTSVSNRTFKGTGCPSCAKYGYDSFSNGYLYFLIHPIWEIYQLGITNDPKVRLARHAKNGFELIELRGPMDGQATQELEVTLLRFLKNQKAALSPKHIAGKFDGYTESWTINSYKVNNLKELIDKATESGF